MTKRKVIVFAVICIVIIIVGGIGVGFTLSSQQQSDPAQHLYNDMRVWQPEDMLLIGGIPYILQDGTLYRHIQEKPGVFLESEKEWVPVVGAEHIRQIFDDGQGGICYLLEDGTMHLDAELYPEEYLGNSEIVFEVARQMMKLNETYSFACVGRVPIAQSNEVIMQDGTLWYWNLEEAAFNVFDKEKSTLKGEPVYVEGGILLTDEGNVYVDIRENSLGPIEYKCISEGEEVVSLTINAYDRRGYLMQTADGRTLSVRHVRKYPNDRNDMTMINDPLPVSEWKNVTPCYVNGDLAIGITEKGKPVIAAAEKNKWSEMQKSAIKELLSWKNICYITVHEGAYIGMKQDGSLVRAKFEE